MPRNWKKAGRYFTDSRHHRDRLTRREIHGLEQRAAFLERDLRREYLLERDGDQDGRNFCAYCKREFSGQLKPTIDHVIPLALRGKDDLENLILSCKDCNRDKGRLRREYFEVVKRPIILARIQEIVPPPTESELVACVA